MTKPKNSTDSPTSKRLTIVEKFKILNTPMKSQRSLAREFGISVSSINSIFKQKDAITKLYESNCYELRKKVTVKSGANDALNKAMAF